jgi:5-methylcytosine-specific restriction endonuclease McrA
VTLRRYAPMKESRGTVIPPGLRVQVFARDRGCIGFGLLPGDCAGPLELDHVRASHGIGLKSATTSENLVSLCGSHHRWKTEHGREARPLLLEYLSRFGSRGEASSG